MYVCMYVYYVGRAVAQVVRIKLLTRKALFQSHNIDITYPYFTQSHCPSRLRVAVPDVFVVNS
jgi:hypothetical protein